MISLQRTAAIFLSSIVVTVMASHQVRAQSDMPVIPPPSARPQNPPPGAQPQQPAPAIPGLPPRTSAPGGVTMDDLARQGYDVKTTTAIGAQPGRFLVMMQRAGDLRTCMMRIEAGGGQQPRRQSVCF